jgi:hypothetical protein
MPQRPSERIDDAVRKVLEAMAPKKEAAAPMCSTTSNDFTTAHQNTHLSMLLKRRDFADWDAIPWGILGFVALVRR